MTTAEAGKTTSLLATTPLLRNVRSKVKNGPWTSEVDAWKHQCDEIINNNNKIVGELDGRDAVEV